MERWARAKYQPNLPLEGRKYVTGCEEHIQLSRDAAREGMVLLKNEGQLLPLTGGQRVATFGKAFFDTVKGGGGSGDVHCAYVRNFTEGLREYGSILYPPLYDFYEEYVQNRYIAGAMPGMMAEPALDPQLVAGAAAFTDTALICLSRYSGEGWDRSEVKDNEDEYTLPEIDALNTLVDTANELFPKRDFYLTDAEQAMVEAVCAAFPRVIVLLNIGGIIDTSWIHDDKRIGACLLTWQGGMEGACAAADLLFGENAPSGRLPDTFAARLEDYPSTEGFLEYPGYVEYREDIYVGYRYFETIPGAADRVVYPFGYGLSYTTFEEECRGFEEQEEELEFRIAVKNTGTTNARQVTAIYYSAPDALLGRPAKELGCFAKTQLLKPGEEQELTLRISKRQMAAYDDLGRLRKNAWILEGGIYRFYLGANVRESRELKDCCWTLNNTQILEQLCERLAPTDLAQRLRSDGSFESLPTGGGHDKNECPFPRMKSGTDECVVPETYGRGQHYVFRPTKQGAHVLSEVAEGKVSMDDFLAQLSDEELIRLTGGIPNTGVAITFGMGGIPEYGIPPIMTSDGPAGVRIEEWTGVRTTAWPCATLLASTWDTQLIRQVGECAAKELKENNMALWLAPAMNIHRNPMCGRNFEYFSEDPYLTGKMAAAEVEGIQSQQVGACVKHLACNNKETNRKHSDSRLSERALREIYLKGFEIAVREARPWALMSSYNVINGWRASESKDLLTGILREEWGYQGVVTSDWWNRSEQYLEILAGNDLKMGCGYPERVRKAMEAGLLKREDLLVSVRRILKLICKLE